ncbi:aminoglycoside phosphotransferase family protein [Streptomyces sp. WMMC940]|uniref:aminoglycoside phosphotransferase family protein n=1 Tax=Streptomyces sp. WMMC940 TaxID=3015153 RepID=UPI0022B72C8D|nr:aminoglycoside phosphotransferase family protein [Streptomyces sp. WMMC940]MCZ7456362.1 aminoglycoside phosphotransferase family protein [Streptomyces sp. WMMC940]
MSVRTTRDGAALIDEALVRRLLRRRFPRWADLPVTAVSSAGTANAMFRLGRDMVVRLPCTPGSADDVDKEHQWLPRLAPSLPAAVPAPLGKGVPGGGFPWPWSVYGWLDGENPVPGRLAEPLALAGDLAGFVGALHGIDPADGPASYRAEPLRARDAGTRAAIGALEGIVDAGAAVAAWEASLRVPGRDGPRVWVHADLQPGNLLLVGGRLGAVIDFGCLGLGDPAVDLIVAWYVLTAEARRPFRAALGVDEAAWLRGRGWALSIALAELRHYRDTNPRMAAVARHVVHEVLRDHGAHRPAGRA